MGVSTNERVRKHRAQKSKTKEGKEQLLAKNREYAARSRAKKEFNRLAEERDIVKSVLGLSPQEISDIDSQVATYRLSVREKYNYDEFRTTHDENRKIELKVIRWEVKLLKKTAKEDVMDTVGVLLNLKNVARKSAEKRPAEKPAESIPDVAKPEIQVV